MIKYEKTSRIALSESRGRNLNCFSLKPVATLRTREIEAENASTAINWLCKIRL